LQTSDLRKDILAAWDFYQGFKGRQPRGVRRAPGAPLIEPSIERFALVDDLSPELQIFRASAPTPHFRERWLRDAKVA